jgi:hypothetical protein
VVVCLQLLGSACIAEHSPALVPVRASEEVMRKTIRRVSRDLQDVS